MQVEMNKLIVSIKVNEILNDPQAKIKRELALNLLFDFQVDMKIFDKTVLLSSVNDGKILVPKNNDLIGLFTATGRLLGCCDAKFQEIVLDTKNTKILFSKAQINSEYVDFNFSMDTDNDYYEMHYVFLFLRGCKFQSIR